MDSLPLEMPQLPQLIATDGTIQSLNELWDFGHIESLIDSVAITDHSLNQGLIMWVDAHADKLERSVNHVATKLANEQRQQRNEKPIVIRGDVIIDESANWFEG